MRETVAPEGTQQILREVGREHRASRRPRCALISALAPSSLLRLQELRREKVPCGLFAVPVGVTGSSEAQVLFGESPVKPSGLVRPPAAWIEVSHLMRATKTCTTQVGCRSFAFIHSLSVGFFPRSLSLPVRSHLSVLSITNGGFRCAHMTICDKHKLNKLVRN